MGRKSAVSLILIFAGRGTCGRLSTILVVLGSCERSVTLFRLFVGKRCWFGGIVVLVGHCSQVSSILLVLSIKRHAFSKIYVLFLPVSWFAPTWARIVRALKLASPILRTLFRAWLLSKTLFRWSLLLRFAPIFIFSPGVLVLELRVGFGLVMFFWSVNITSLQITVLLHCSLLIFSVFLCKTVRYLLINWVLVSVSLCCQLKDVEDRCGGICFVWVRFSLELILVASMCVCS